MKTSKRHEDHIASIRRGETKLERAGKYWTEEEREQLQKLYEMGEDLTDLMLQFQRYENAILEQLKSLHMLAPTQTPRLRGQIILVASVKSVNEGLSKLREGDLLCWKCMTIF